jgi:hypothetical protein
LKKRLTRRRGDAEEEVKKGEGMKEGLETAGKWGKGKAGKEDWGR